MSNPLPESIESTLLVHIDPHSDKPVAMTCDMTEFGYVLLGSVTVTVPVPQVDVIEAEIASLERKADAVRAEFHRKLTAITDRIQSLRAIEHKEQS